MQDWRPGHRPRPQRRVDDERVRWIGNCGASPRVSASHTCALLTTGRATCWGYNNTGQRGNGSFTSALTPTAVLGLEGATTIASGYRHSCAVLDDGTAACWGNNVAGQLGDVGATVQPTPVLVQGL